jgi:hypothetical protein
MLGRGKFTFGLLSRKLVQALREALSGSAGVDEDDRRVVFLDEFQQLRVNRGPDRADVGVRLALRRYAVGIGEVGGAGVGHVLNRDDDLEVELLLPPGVDDRALPLGPDEKLRHPLQRALSRGQPNPLDTNSARLLCSRSLAIT